MATIAPGRRATSARSPSRAPSCHRITVDEYERIIASSSLDDPGRVELIDGYLVDKMGKNVEHGYATKQIFKLVDQRLPPGWTSRKEEPVRIPDYDEPEPDVSIVRGSDADYRHRIPSALDVALLVEVSESTLRQDRGVKRAASARVRIPMYWIVNLVARQVEVHTRRVQEGHYRSRQSYKAGQQVPVKIGGVILAPIAVDDILP